MTALVSAMSLNFFLTVPYLTLAIEKPDDVVAFFALAGCGLIAAWFGKRRAGLSEVVSRAGTELDVLKRLVDQLTAGFPWMRFLATYGRASASGRSCCETRAAASSVQFPSARHRRRSQRLS